MTQQVLPIYDIADDLVTTFTTASRLILTAPTGSGKSTQVPQILLDRGLLGTGEVVVLQPRRLAARLLAVRVAEERGVSLGTEVGYQVRLDAQVSAATRIRPRRRSNPVSRRSSALPSRRFRLWQRGRAPAAGARCWRTG